MVALSNLAEYPLPDGSTFRSNLLEYFCPGCATLLQVDIHCPSVDDPWLDDMELKSER